MKLAVKAMPPRTFNRLCAAIAMAWLASTVTLAQLYKPNMGDFGAYYMGAVMARHGQWSSLYPEPVLGANCIIGEPSGSTPSAEYRRLAQQHGVGDTYRFMALPHVALLMAPLAWLDYRTAHWVWLGLSLLAAWYAILAAGRVLELLEGRPTRFSGLLVLALAVSPLAHRCIRVCNVSCVVAMLAAVALMGMLRYRPARTAVAAVVGTTGKFVLAIWAPLLIVLRQWRTVAWCAVAAAVMAAGFLVTGLGPYRDYARKVVPTLDTVQLWSGNQSAHGLAQRAAGTPGRLAPGADMDIKILSGLLLAAMLILLLRKRRQIQGSPACICAAALALLAWCALASNIFWEHYYIYFAPFWGYLAWEARQSRMRAVVAVGAMALTFAPLCVVPRLHLPEPLNSHMLFGAVAMLCLALWRLFKPLPLPAQRAAATESMMASTQQ